MTSHDPCVSIDIPLAIRTSYGRIDVGRETMVGGGTIYTKSIYFVRGGQLCTESTCYHLPDRSGWLTCFGLFLWFLACLCLVKITFLLVPPDTPAWLLADTVPIFLPDSAIVTAALYATVAVLLFVMGVGIHWARRWARTGTLVFSWGWLIVGLTNIVFSWQIGVAYFCFALLFDLLPISFLLFLRSPSVKATFDYRDPRPRMSIRRYPSK